MCVRAMAHVAKTVASTSTDAYFVPVTGWVSAVGIDGVRYGVTIRNPVNNVAVLPGAQLASVRTSKPSAPVEVQSGSYVTSGDVPTSFDDVPSSATSSLFIRFGVWVKQSTSSANVSQCDVELDVALLFSGEILGAHTVEVVPGIPNNQVMYYPLTDWFPASGASDAVAGFVVMDCASSSLGYKLACRTSIDKNAPNSWEELETSFDFPGTGNDERNTGQKSLGSLSPSVDNVQWIQFGVAVKSTSSTATVRAMIHGACGLVQTH
ncbi:MAG: hypothetical protein ACI9K5_002083 [Gammaproteobacteria bacterium]|jgi:hypothetical protein